jgi:hypothetical protein
MTTPVHGDVKFPISGRDLFLQAERRIPLCACEKPVNPATATAWRAVGGPMIRAD